MAACGRKRPGSTNSPPPGARQIFAVNTPPQESDLAPWPDPAQLTQLESADTPPPCGRPAALPPLRDEAAENQQRLWWWALALCAAAILAELALANRTAL